MMRDDSEFNKEISYILRHAPWEYGLELSDEGWVSLNQLLASLKSNTKWKDIPYLDIETMVEHSQKNGMKYQI